MAKNDIAARLSHQPQNRAARRHPERELVPLAEGAAYLGVSKMTLRRLVADGRVNAYRIGTQIVRVDLLELEAMVNAGKIPTTVAVGGGDR